VLIIFKENIVSLIDTPFFNGELKILCEATDMSNGIMKTSISHDLLMCAIAFESKMRLDIENRLTYKSELLAAMTQCTEKFLNSKDIADIFSDVLIIMGNATKSHRAYYYDDPFY
jgi:hypothetical protein